MSILQWLAVGFLTGLLSSCVTTTPPTPLGDGRYVLTLNARGGFQSDGALLTQTINTAHAFCQEQGQRAHILNTSTSGVQMWTPQNNQVIFRCVAE